MSRPPRIMLSAGETSGDRLGAGLAAALRERRPDLELVGMGGPRMAAAGVRLVQDSHEVAVVGIFEVLAHLPAIRRAMKRLEATLERERPDLLVPIDFPDFNLRLADRAGRHGVPVVYFVSPQIWAWRRGRVKRIRRLVRRMLVLFPFELEIYSSAGVPVSFVGHPLAEPGEPLPEREVICSSLGLDPLRRVVALLPGSRRGEVARLLPILLDAAERLGRSHPELQFVLPLAPDLSESWIRQLASQRRGVDLHVHSGGFAEILSISEAGVVAAGTASLEAAVAGLPLVVVYRMNTLSYLIGRTLVRIDDVALPNLVAGERVVPELIQAECRAERIAEALARYLDDPREISRVRGKLEIVRQRLGGAGIYGRAADAILGELG